jgi:hypothetical protein
MWFFKPYDSSNYHRNDKNNCPNENRHNNPTCFNYFLIRVVIFLSIFRQ